MAVINLKVVCQPQRATHNATSCISLQGNEQWLTGRLDLNCTTIVSCCHLGSKRVNDNGNEFYLYFKPMYHHCSYSRFEKKRKKKNIFILLNGSLAICTVIHLTESLKYSRCQTESQLLIKCHYLRWHLHFYKRMKHLNLLKICE